MQSKGKRSIAVILQLQHVKALNINLFATVVALHIHANLSDMSKCLQGSHGRVLRTMAHLSYDDNDIVVIMMFSRLPQQCGRRQA